MMDMLLTVGVIVVVSVAGLITPVLVADALGLIELTIEWRGRPVWPRGRR